MAEFTGMHACVHTVCVSGFVSPSRPPPLVTPVGLPFGSRIEIEKCGIRIQLWAWPDMRSYTGFGPWALVILPPTAPVGTPARGSRRGT